MGEKRTKSAMMFKDVKRERRCGSDLRGLYRLQRLGLYLSLSLHLFLLFLPHNVKMKRLFGKNSNPNPKQQVTPWKSREEEQYGGYAEQNGNHGGLNAASREPPSSASYPSYSEQQLDPRDGNKHRHSTQILYQQHQQQSRDRRRDQQSLNRSASLLNEYSTSSSNPTNPSAYQNQYSIPLSASARSAEQQLSPNRPPSPPHSSIRAIPAPSSVSYQDQFQSSQPMFKSNSSHSHSRSNSNQHPISHPRVPSSPPTTQDGHRNFSTASGASNGNRGTANDSQDGDAPTGKIKRWRSLRGSKDKENGAVGRKPNLQETMLQPGVPPSPALSDGNGGGFENENYQNGASHQTLRDGNFSEDVSPYPVYSDTVPAGIQAETFNASPIPTSVDKKKDQKDGMKKFMAGFGGGKKEKEKQMAVVEREIPLQNPNLIHLNSESPSSGPASVTYASLGKKEGGWFDSKRDKEEKKEKVKEEKKDKGKEMEEQVRDRISEFSDIFLFFHM